MTTTSPDLQFASPEAPARTSTKDAARVRDPRLDFFRGLAMFIILVAHTPGNTWGRWIPGRFGFSDATEIFVFCSGMASAIAFGSTFARKGWLMGAARTLFRVWQVYWAHIGLFFFVAMMLAAFDMSGDFDRSYVEFLYIHPFFADPEPLIVGLFTLTYVPNYFDILPMYLIILAMMPIFIGLARLHVVLAFGASIALWLACNWGLLPLPAEPWSDREWFFNPFGWQLIFFTGFSFMAGYLPPPPVSRALVWAAIAILVVTLPLSSPHAVTFLKTAWPAAAEWAMETYPKILGLRTKTEFGILRYLHFLSLAYLAWIAVGPGGSRLMATGDDTLSNACQWLVTVVTKVGQQSLAIFVFSMVFALVIGFGLDRVAGTGLTVLLANLVGFATLIAVAYAVAWFKGQPWRSKRPPDKEA